jgi:hypothetical protein
MNHEVHWRHDVIEWINRFTKHKTIIHVCNHSEKENNDWEIDTSERKSIFIGFESDDEALIFALKFKIKNIIRRG